jgi:hypothetical protein
MLKCATHPVDSRPRPSCWVVRGARRCGSARPQLPDHALRPRKERRRWPPSSVFEEGIPYWDYYFNSQLQWLERLATDPREPWTSKGLVVRSGARSRARQTSDVDTRRLPVMLVGEGVHAEAVEGKAERHPVLLAHRAAAGGSVIGPCGSTTTTWIGVYRLPTRPSGRSARRAGLLLGAVVVSRRGAGSSGRAPSRRLVRPSAPLGRPRSGSGCRARFER